MAVTTVNRELTPALTLPLTVLRQSSGKGNRFWKLHLDLNYPTLSWVTLALDSFDGERTTRRQVTLSPAENAQVLYAAGESVEVVVLSVSAPTILVLRLVEGTAGLATWTTCERVDTAGSPVTLDVPTFAVDLTFTPLGPDLATPETVLLLTDDHAQTHQMPVRADSRVSVLPGYTYQVPAENPPLRVTYTCCG